MDNGQSFVTLYLSLWSDAAFALLPGIASAIAAVALILAAVGDAESRHIPNRYPLAVALGGLVFLLFMPGSGIVESLLLAAAVFVAGLFAFARGWLGGGDVKLLSGTILWVGLAYLPLFLVIMALATVAIAVAMLFRSAYLARARLAEGPPQDQLKAPLPLGIAIGVAGILVILHRLAILPWGSA